ncbi:hypothetical protein RND71_036499 [Anisodus tanguticus]|uniref:Programmed cell death protein 4-like n=1 Tax=Anisodus tanguticus TaxID=243964 RepID=A0AAE1V0B8_9SOLA|nr:hypothetical protein RND71_036499 [Anisodus tanguticus]
MKNTSKSSKISLKSGQDARKDRRSATGMNGSPKKGGHGGKFTWAGPEGDESYWAKKEAVIVDANDPNFDEPEENTTEI